VVGKAILIAAARLGLCIFGYW